MVSGRIHPPDRVVHPEGHPGEGDVVPHQERREHPPELVGPEPTVVRIAQEQRTVVPVDEPIGESGKVAKKGQDDRCQGEQKAPLVRHVGTRGT